MKRISAFNVAFIPFFCYFCFTVLLSEAPGLVFVVTILTWTMLELHRCNVTESGGVGIEGRVCQLLSFELTVISWHVVFCVEAEVVNGERGVCATGFKKVAFGRKSIQSKPIIHNSATDFARMRVVRLNFSPRVYKSKRKPLSGTSRSSTCTSCSFQYSESLKLLVVSSP